MKKGMNNTQTIKEIRGAVIHHIITMRRRRGERMVSPSNFDLYTLEELETLAANHTAMVQTYLSNSHDDLAAKYSSPDLTHYCTNGHVNCSAVHLGSCLDEDMTELEAEMGSLEEEMEEVHAKVKAKMGRK